MFLNVPKLGFLVWMTFLLIIMTYPSSLVKQFFVKSQPYKKKTLKFLILYMKQKILIYLCLNAIFSETMQDTETKILQFILEGTAN